MGRLLLFNENFVCQEVHVKVNGRLVRSMCIFSEVTLWDIPK